MKKGTIITIIVAVSLGIAGIGLSLGGLAMGATMEGLDVLRDLDVLKDLENEIKDFMNMDEWDEDEFRVLPDAIEGDGETTVYDLDAVSGMDIDLKYDSLGFYTHKESGIKVEVINDSRSDVQVEMEGNTIKIEGEKKVLDRTVNIYYPENFEFRHVGIEVDAGFVSMKEDFYVNELDVTIGAGDFLTEGAVNADKLEIEVGAGKVEMNHLTVSEVEADCGVGSLILKLTGKETDYHYQMECGMGEIIIGGDSYGGISKEKHIRNDGASGMLQLECGMGNIEITFEN